MWPYVWCTDVPRLDVLREGRRREARLFQIDALDSSLRMSFHHHLVNRIFLAECPDNLHRIPLKRELLLTDSRLRALLLVSSFPHPPRSLPHCSNSITFNPSRIPHAPKASCLDSCRRCSRAARSVSRCGCRFGSRPPPPCPVSGPPRVLSRRGRNDPTGGRKVMLANVMIQLSYRKVREIRNVNSDPGTFINLLLTCTWSSPCESTQPKVMSAPRIPPLGEKPSPAQPLVATWRAGGVKEGQGR